MSEKAARHAASASRRRSVAVWHGIVEGDPIALAPGLTVVPVVAWATAGTTAAAGAAATVAILVEPLAVIECTARGTRRVAVSRAPRRGAGPSPSDDHLPDGVRRALAASAFRAGSPGGQVAARRGRGQLGPSGLEVEMFEPVATLAARRGRVVVRRDGSRAAPPRYGW